MEEKRIPGESLETDPEEDSFFISSADKYLDS
jgi:hypothetical protein